MPDIGSSRTDGGGVPSGRIAASFRFYAELNDFLSPERRGRTIEASYLVSPSVKDAIEAHGVPHVEVDLILANNEPVGFDYRVRAEDRIAVYPVFEALDIAPAARLGRAPLCRTCFVADVHLRKLSRLLRLMGFDVLHSPTSTDPELVDVSVRTGRILLTRDRALLKHGRLTHGYWVRSVHPRRQAVEVVRRFDLAGEIRLLSRCPRCNGVLKPVDKADVLSRIPPRTAAWVDEYVECVSCGKLYWHGTHVDRIRAVLDRILRDAAS